MNVPFGLALGSAIAYLVTWALGFSHDGGGLVLAMLTIAAYIREVMLHRQWREALSDIRLRLNRAAQS